MNRRTLLTAAALLMLAPNLVGCPEPPPPIALSGEVATVACGFCRFKIEGARMPCFWAVRIGDDHFAVKGEQPKKHDNHAPDGMCNIERQARLTGKVVGGSFVATKFELLDVDPTTVPAKPEYSDADAH